MSQLWTDNELTYFKLLFVYQIMLEKVAKSQLLQISWLDQVNPNQVYHIKVGKLSSANQVDTIEFNKSSWSN